MTIASDLHNNVISLPILERAAGDGPVFFAGDLSDRGSPLETALVARVARDRRARSCSSPATTTPTARRRSWPTTARSCSRERGRLKRGGGFGPIVNEIAGIRVAGYSDPFQRRESEDFRDRFEPEPTPEQQRGLRRLAAAARSATSTSCSSTSRR